MPCTKLHDAPDMHEYCFVPCDPAASFSWISSSAVSVLAFLQGAGPVLWGDRPCATYSLRQNNGFAKGVAANSPLCFHAPKNFQKFCAVSPSFFFLSMTYGLSIFSAKSSNPSLPQKTYFSAPVQKMIFAVVARAARMRSAGAQHTWVPMRPPETYTFSCARTLSSNTVLYCFFMPTGLQPPRT